MTDSDLVKAPVGTGAQHACDGLKVLDFGQGMAGAMPGMILADNGADVVKVEPPQGDWARSQAGFLMWNRNKRSAVLDLSVGANQDRARALVARADVLIESFSPGVADELGIGWNHVQRDSPRLVYCSITGFGPAADYRDLPGYEGLVSAVMGRMVGLDHLNGAVRDQDRDAPIFTSVPIASYGAAQLATQGILAALEQRRRTGCGDRVTTSLVQGAAAFLMRQEMPRGSSPEASLVSPAAQAGIELCFMTARCKDGRYLQMCARQDSHFRNWLTALGLESLLDDPKFARAPLGISGLDDVAALERRIRERMLVRTQDDWMRAFTTDYDVGCDPFLTPEEFLRHPDMVRNGRVVDFDDPTVGRCRQVGPLVIFSDTPSAIDRPAPLLGEHTAEVLSEIPSDPSHPAPVTGAIRRHRVPAHPGTSALNECPPAAAGELPLNGITVLEVAYYIAGPLAGALLSELGARVIKVEPLEGDPYRRTGLQSAKFLHGKESIALNLKDPEGTAVLHKLVQQADIFVHSFRPGKLGRLKMDYGTLSALNPALIYLYAGSYGSQGPQASRAAFHSTPNALSGAGIMQAGDGNPPVDDSFPDPGSALGAATALLLGLYARALTGRGQSLETTMLASTGYVMSPSLVLYDDGPPARCADRGQHGFDALYRLYPCSDGWLFISCLQPREWQSLAQALDHPEWLADSRFAQRAGRLKHDSELVAAIGAELTKRPAGDWAECLTCRGVPAAKVSECPQEVWFERQHLLREATHPIFGDYWYPPTKVSFDSTEARSAPASAIGEHSVPLLRSLGYAEAEVDRLVHRGVVGTWPSPAQPGERAG